MKAKFNLSNQFNVNPKMDLDEGFSLLKCFVFSIPLGHNVISVLENHKQKANKQKFEDVTLTSRCKKLLVKRVPIFGWIGTYKVGDLIADAIAGITVGLTVVPQSMAYAAIAGLSPEYGLYSAYIACLIYVVLGSCKQATIGPTAVMGLLTFQTCGNNYPQCAVLTAFYSGVFELLMALLQLGWVVSFISEPVTIGFTAGASTTIISSQIKSFFGIKGEKGSGFIGYWQAVFRDIGTISLGDSILGILCFIALLLLRKLKDVKIGDKSPSPVLKKSFWLISVSRNVIVVLTTSIIAYIWQHPPFKITGHVAGGFPTVQPPAFLLPNNNDTGAIYGESMEGTFTFSETWSIIKTGPIVIALIAVLQNVAISKTFGAGQSVDATQEMFALGICNMVGGFLSAIPTSGSFSRSAVNEASGVRSPLGGLFTGVLVLFALNFLASSFYFIPKASLAAVIISAVMFMIEFEALIPMWKISKIDLVTCLLTFFSSIILGMEYGILCGVGLSTGAILMNLLKPKMSEELKIDDGIGTKYFYITPESGLLFPSVDFIRTRMNKLSLKYKNVKYYFLNMSKWRDLDYTGATALQSLVKGFEKNGKPIQFLNCNETWTRILHDVGMTKVPSLPHESDIKEFIRKQVTNTNVIVNIPNTNCEVLAVSPTTTNSGSPEYGSTILLTSLNNMNSLNKNNNCNINTQSSA